MAPLLRGWHPLLAAIAAAAEAYDAAHPLRGDLPRTVKLPLTRRRVSAKQPDVADRDLQKPASNNSMEGLTLMDAIEEELFMSMETIVTSMSVELNEMSMSMDVFEVSIPLELSEVSTSIGTSVGMPSKLRRLLVTVNSPCFTEETCRNRFETMHDAGVLTGHFYAGDHYPIKGCVLKGNNMIFGSGGTIEEMSEPLSGKKQRVWCGQEGSSTTVTESANSSSSPTFNPSTPRPTYTPTLSPTNEMTNSLTVATSLTMELSEMSMPITSISMSLPREISGMEGSSTTVTESANSSSSPTFNPSTPWPTYTPTLSPTNEMTNSLTVATSLTMELSEMNMSMASISMSLPREISGMCLSMGASIDLSMPIKPSEMSMSSLGTVELSAPFELSEISLSMGPIELGEIIMFMETDAEISMPIMLSMPTETIELSMPIQLNQMELIELSMQIIELSLMSMSTMDTIEWSMPMELSEMSMSMASIAMSLPREISGMCLSMGASIDLSMPIKPSEMSMSSLGTVELSAPFELSEISLLMGPIELGEISMFMETDAEISMPIMLSMPTETIELSMPIQLNQMELIELSMQIIELSLMSTSTAAIGSTGSPVTISPTALSPVETVELSDASILVTNIPSKFPTKSPTLFPSKLPTNSPTLGPTTNDPTAITVKANTQFQLIGMDADMDTEASNVFEQSCASFLMKNLADAQISCEVTNQRLLIQRSLRAGRGLQRESSLLVDVTVVRTATFTSSVSESPDANFDNQVMETFASHSSQFTTQLQEDGIDAGVDDFEILTSISVNVIGGDVSEIVESSPDDSESPENGNKKGQYLAIVAVSIGFLALIMLSIYRRSKLFNASTDDNSFESESSI